MFGRLLWESFVRQRRRKALAGVAILLGTTAVTAMLALATTIGDRIHRELAVYGANIVVYPKADTLSVNVGGVDLKPSTGGAYLHESDLAKLKTIFWANNITGVSPELPVPVSISAANDADPSTQNSQVPLLGRGLWFDHSFGNVLTGAPQLHPTWHIEGRWPRQIPLHHPCAGICAVGEVVLGHDIATQLQVHLNSYIFIRQSPHPYLVIPPNTVFPALFSVVGIASTGSELDRQLLFTLADAQVLAGHPNEVSRVEISARTKPEDAFARKDPDTLSAKQREVWYCRPYANSIAYQIQEAIPGSRAEQVRRVEQSEGTVLARISGLMWLVSAAALLAAGFAVSAAMATAVLERRGEIGLMRSLGASRGSIALLFYAETGLLAVMAGVLGYFAGSLLAYWLGSRVFVGDSSGPVLIGVLLPVVVALALVVAVAGSTPSIRSALRMDPSAVLRGDR